MPLALAQALFDAVLSKLSSDKPCLLTGHSARARRLDPTLGVALSLACGLACAQSLTTPSSAQAAAQVPQQTAAAQAVREQLKTIQLPPGFQIELLALVPGARHMAIRGDGRRLWVGTYGPRVWQVDLAPNFEQAPQVTAFAPELGWRISNGVCLNPAGDLFVVDLNRVTVFRGLAAGKPPSHQHWVAEGQLIPPQEESRNHAARVCRVGPDGWLYIALGQPYNVQPPEKLSLYERLGIGGIVRLHPHNPETREVYARGVRNSVGMAFHPQDGSLWFTDNQTDNLGDDQPTGEINRATAPGQFFGYPYINGATRIPAYGYDRLPLPPHSIDPEVDTQAHAADLGLSFYSGRQFPSSYQGALFSAQHGSWNRSTPVGAQILVTQTNAQHRASGTRVFAHGWLTPQGRYWGRPVDVAPLPDGSLLVSDDHAGAIYRISYAKPHS